MVYEIEGRNKNLKVGARETRSTYTCRDTLSRLAPHDEQFSVKMQQDDAKGFCSTNPRPRCQTMLNQVVLRPIPPFEIHRSDNICAASSDDGGARRARRGRLGHAIRVGHVVE